MEVDTKEALQEDDIRLFCTELGPAQPQLFVLYFHDL